MLPPWTTTVFHILRGSLETELAENHPIHVVAQCLGNTPKVAAYTLTTSAG
jgi:hypothetical protein